MVVSAVRVEIPTTAEAETSAQPDELEIVAAIAAVVACLDATDNQSNRPAWPAVNGDDTERGGWRKAAYHEAAGGTRLVTAQPYCKLPAWQASRFLKVCLSLPIACLSLFLVAGSSLAQNEQADLRPLPADQAAAASSGDSAHFAASAQTNNDDQRSIDKTARKTGERVVSPAPISRPVQGRTMYSRISPPQGYPFINGRTSGSSGSFKRPSSATVQKPQVDQAQGAAGAIAGETKATVSTATVVSPDMQESEPANIQNTNVVPTANPPQNRQSIDLQQMKASGTGLKSAVPAPFDPIIQTLNQATTQLNPAFLNKKTVVKIGLYFANTKMDLAAVDGAQVRDATSGALVANLRPCSRWDLALQNSGRYSQLALISKRPTDAAAPSRDIPDGLASTTYGESSKYRNVAFFPSPAPISGPASIRLPLKLLGCNSLANQSDQAASPSISSSGYIVSPRQDEPNHVLVVNGKLYRGAIWLRPVPRLVATGQYRAAAFDVINLVDVEDYLLSVVPSEMPSSWPLEALKAQAVAARSYAIANLGKHGKEGYDLKATIDDQVYSGVSSENDNSNRAVAETSELVLKHEGKPIMAFFHSTSGGSTEFSEHVWGRSLPYLQSVPDFDDASPHFSWTKKVSVDDLERMIGNDIGRLLSLSVVARTGSNRAQYLLAQGSSGSKLLTGENMRKLFKLPSTLFNVGSEANAYIFAGRGYGHGLGMSQYGAKALAERGCNAAQILSYYYKDVTVDYTAAAPGI